MTKKGTEIGIQRKPEAAIGL